MFRRWLHFSFVFIIGVVHAAPAVMAEERAWPFYLPREHEPPKVEAEGRVRNEIDRFVLERLEAKGLTLSPEASKETLIRRVTFDLIGLPPTPAEIEAFVANQDPKAYENLVDRLLKDARYGERWARFWLDLARYADTAGYEGDPDLPWAWRYRDYVIDSLNRDKSYDRFIKEQIAGDEFNEVMGAGDLPKTPDEHVVALTFLRLAPFTEPRGDETRHEFLSEMTSTVASVFLGLTVGCAQCHHHKYDDIPTKDFYRMQAFFSTVSMPRPEPGDGYQIGGPIPAAHYRKGEKEYVNVKRAEFERERTGAGDELKALEKRILSRVKKELDGAGFGIQACGGPLGNNYVYDTRVVHDGKKHVSMIQSDGERWRFFTDARESSSTGKKAGGNVGQWFGDLPKVDYLQLGGWTNGTGKIHADAWHHGHFAEVLIYDRALGDEERARVEAYLAKKYDGRESEAAKAAPEMKGLRLWLDASDIDANPETPNPPAGSSVSSWIDRVAGIEIRQDEDRRKPKMDTLGEAKAPALLFRDQYLLGHADSASFAKDQAGTIVVVYSATHANEGYGFEVVGGGAYLSTFVNPAAAANSPTIDRLLANPNSDVTKEERRRYKFLRRADPFIKQRLKRLQPLAMSLRHSYGPPFEPGVPTTHVKIRGEYNHLGETVEAGFPRCVTGHEKPAMIRLDPFKRWPTRSRRMALANWIASKDNPLTARVLVNRLWYRHFGRGIVATPSDFGKLSGGPSHTELLDWLARDFVAKKWSLKAMHRVMVTSATYRQSSNRDDKASFEADPGNVLLWRMSRRRLEAEAVRDAVLSVSGRLNPEIFGLPIFPPLPESIDEEIKYSNSKWDTSFGPESRKRSIYIYQQRTLSMPLMQAFDAVVCDTSRPQRRASVTALQALALYNGEFVNEETQHFAERVKKEASDDVDAQIRHAFLLAFGRTPTGKEAALLRELVTSQKSRDAGLRGLCRILYNANEFVYVD